MFPIIKTDPTIEQLQLIAQSVDWLIIDWIDDQEWFEKVKEHRIKLKNIRVEITKQCKSMREDAIKHQKDVIVHEKMLIDIIEPTELKLKWMEDKIKEMKEIEERRKILPDRMNEIKRSWFSADPEFIVTLTSDQFNLRLTNERSKKFMEMKAKEDEEKERKEKEENEQRIRDEAIQKEKERAEKEKADMERKHKEDIERIQKEAEDKERKRIADEKTKEEEEDRERKKAEKNKKYKERLDDNSYNDNDYIIKSDAWNSSFYMYKLVSSITIL